MCLSVVYRPLTGYIYCSSVSATLKHTSVSELYNFTSAMSICQGHGIQMFSVAAHHDQCAVGFLSSTTGAWVNQKNSGGNILTSLNTYIPGTRKQIAVCEIRK